MPPSRLSWAWRGLLALSVAIPLVLFAAAARQNYSLVENAAESQVLQTTDELNEQAMEAFVTYDLVLGRTEDRLAGHSWDEIANDRDLHRFLSDLDAFPQINAVSVVDPNGRVRASGSSFPAPALNVSGRDYFFAQKPGAGAGLFIGKPHASGLNGRRKIDVSRRLTGPGGAFNGVVALSIRLSYFRKFYSTLSAEKGFAAMLLREDGTVLVRYPEPPRGLRFRPNGRLMRAIAAVPERGTLRLRSRADGRRRIYGYERVAGFPIYVAFGIPVNGVLAAWNANLVTFSMFAVPASLALLLMTLFAARQLRRQQIASWRWRGTARRLRREMDRRAQTEAELRQAQKMEALGQLTGGVAHDFNNLLTVLQGNLELLKGRLGDESKEAKLDEALRTVERGERLTGQLLAFARRNALSIEDIDLNAHLREMADLMARTVGSGVAVESNFADDLWPAQADPDQLELAVLNLAINARDAMPNGGALRINTSNVRRSREPRGDFVALAISDTGVGMPPEVSARAFEPFFTTKEPGRGTGLGLAMVYDFARRSGGLATIDSVAGRGTTVTLFLPRGTSAVGLASAGETTLLKDGRA